VKLPRLSIAKVMAAVAIVAVNFAYLRWFGVGGTLLGTRLIVLILQIGLLFAIFGSVAARRFWIGLVVLGSAAVLGWSYAAGHFPETSDAYFRAAMNAVLRHFPLAGYNRITISEPSHQVLAEVLLTVPQLLIALSGGILLSLVSRRTSAQVNSE
jgi:hypothetical protein